MTTHDDDMGDDRGEPDNEYAPDDEHLCEFQMDGRRLMDPQARRSGPPIATVDPFGKRPPQYVDWDEEE